jgi:hypothetical protein
LPSLKVESDKEDIVAAYLPHIYTWLDENPDATELDIMARVVSLDPAFTDNNVTSCIVTVPHPDPIPHSSMLPLVQKLFSDLGHVSGNGMSGTVTLKSFKSVMDVVFTLLIPDLPWAFCDVGSQAGRMLFLSLVYGASFAFGCEVQQGMTKGRRGTLASPATCNHHLVLDSAIKVFGKHHPFTMGRVRAVFGVDAEGMARFPIHHSCFDNYVGYLFQDGMPEPSLLAVLKRMSRCDSGYRVLVVCKHTAVGSKLGNVAAILDVFGEAWEHVLTVPVTMSGSGSKKEMFVFSLGAALASA